MGEKPRAGFKKTRGVFEKPRGVFNFDHFFHYDGMYFFSHNHICFAPLCLYLCILVVLSLLHHKKDDVILPNSGVAKKKLVAVHIYLQAICKRIKYLASLIRADATCKDSKSWIAGGGHCL